MSPSSSPAFSLRRSSLRANTRLVIVLVIGVIALAAAALFYELRHESGSGKKPDKVKVKAPKEGGKKKKKHKAEGEKASKAPGATTKKPAPAAQ